jgi:hypothetical protein
VLTRILILLPILNLCSLVHTYAFDSNSFSDDNEEESSTWTPPVSPEWTVQRKKTPGDMVNMYIHARTKEDIEVAAKKAGWITASRCTVATDALYAVNVLWRSIGHFLHFGHKKKCYTYPVYKWMPASIQKYDGDQQVYVFQKGDEHLAGRHHFRVFSTGKFDENGIPVWAVSATEDNGTKFDFHNPTQGIFTHKIVKNSDIERDYVFNSLEGTGLMDQFQKVSVQPVSPSQQSGLYSEDHSFYDVSLKQAGELGPGSSSKQDSL